MAHVRDSSPPFAMFKILRPLLPLIARYRWRYLIGTLCIFAAQWFKLRIPPLFWGGLEELKNAEANGLTADQAQQLIVTAALWIFVLALTIAPIRTFSRLLILGSSRRLSADVLAQVFERMLDLAPSFYQKNPTGQIMSRAINDRQFVRGLGGAVYMYMAETFILYVISVPLMLLIDVKLTLLAVLPYPLFLVLARKIALKIQVASMDAQHSLGDITNKVDESLSGQQVVKTLGIEDYDFARFEAESREYRRLNLVATKWRALLMAAMMTLTSISLVTVVSIGGNAVSTGEMAFEDFGVMMTYLILLAVPTRTLGFVISSLRRGAAAYERIREITDTPVDLPEPAQPAGHVTKGAILVRDLNVVFKPMKEERLLSGSLDEAHAESELDIARRVIENVSFEVPAGTTTAIVGHTGSGKSVLARILARQLEVERDSVFVDGIDINDLSIAELRGVTGYVPQDAFLFSESLRDNVALGEPDATDERIFGALDGAQFTTDLDQLPKGLDTMIGERGVNLSGGQRQRTALARVLLLSPRILILDDTLSAVDTNTSDAILEHLRPFAADRTTILIAHRLSSIAHANQILVLEDGQIVERGTHNSLMKLDGRYASTWRLQEESQHEAERTSQLQAELDAEFEAEHEAKSMADDDQPEERP